MIKIVTDSTIGLSEEYCRKNDISMVNLYVNTDKGSFEEGYAEESKKLSETMFDGTLPPTTSQPSPDSFYNVFKKITDEGDEVLYFGISSGVSGTFNSANIAKGMLEENENKIYLFDSKNASTGLIRYLKTAMKLIEEGKSCEYILSEFEKLRSDTKIYFTVDDVEHITRCGRVSKISGTIAGLLSIRPIFTLDDEGKVKVITKVKGKKSQMKHLLDLIPSDSKEVYISYGSKSEIGRDFKEELKLKFPVVEEYALSSVLLVNGGPTAFTVSYMR